MLFNNKVEEMTDDQIIVDEIKTFGGSKERSWMITGDNYYKVENDINKRVMMKSLGSGVYVADDTKTNNKLAHGFMKNLVDEKVAYLLSQDATLKCEDETYLNQVKDALGRKFGYTLTGLGYEASNKGKGWLQPYLNEAGEFKTMIIPAEQCIPIWTDNSHTDLDFMIRYYVQTVYEGQEMKEITKVEYWGPLGVQYFEIYEDDKKQQRLRADVDKLFRLGWSGKEIPEWLPHYSKGSEGKNWNKVPFVCFKNNRIEFPDLRSIKSLVDNYDNSRSDISNFLEDVKNLIYVLKNYGGQDLSEFMSELNYYRAIKVDEDGGVETINPKMDIEAAKAHYEQLKSDIIEFGQGTRKDLDKFGSSPSGIALKFLYSGLDLKANALEVEFGSGFEDLIYFVNVFLAESGKATKQAEVELMLNRDVTMNEAETIKNCVDSSGIISIKTNLANHPWVQDIKEEMAAIAKDQAAKAKADSEAFGLNVETPAGSAGVAAVVEDVAGKTLNGAQTQSLLAVMAQYSANTLSLAQAAGIVALSVGVTKDEAEKLIQGLE